MAVQKKPTEAHRARSPRCSQITRSAVQRNGDVLGHRPPPARARRRRADAVSRQRRLGYAFSRSTTTHYPQISTCRCHTRMKQLHTCTADPSCVDNSQGRSRLVHAAPPSHGCQRDLSRGFDASRSLGAPPRAWRHARYAEGAGWGSWGHTGPKGRREPAEAWKEGSMATGVPQRAHPPRGGMASGEGARGRVPWGGRDGPVAAPPERRAAAPAPRRAARRRAAAAPRATRPTQDASAQARPLLPRAPTLPAATPAAPPPPCAAARPRRPSPAGRASLNEPRAIAPAARARGSGRTAPRRGGAP